MSNPFLAALDVDPSSPPPALRDIAAPVEVFPYTWWQVSLAVLAAVALVALLAWLVVRWWPRPVAAPPPRPRSIALQQLNELRGRIRAMDPYTFSIAVSDVLRHYIDAQYGLRAEKQTSPEFLASISRSKVFSEEDRRQLAAFLERSDLIKFARVDADEQASEELLTTAIAFVQGGRL